jgi:hypothetical protein
MAALAVEVPQLLWGEEAYPVSYVAEEAQLSLSYRLGDGTTRKVIVARVSFHDRLVAGEPGRNVLRDPREVPARESLILLLASRLASNLADEVAGELRRRREALYERALERLEARSFDGATEDLVGFLYARRGTADRRFERAVRLLLELTGCNLPAMW